MNNYYYTKNYKNRATDLRQDQKPKTTTTHETTNDKVNPPSEPTDVNLQTTEDKQHSNSTTTTDCTRKTMNRKKDVAIQVLTATLQLKKGQDVVRPIAIPRIREPRTPRHRSNKKCNVRGRTQTNPVCTPSRTSRRVPSTGLQSPNRKQKHRPGPETGTTSLLHRR